MRNRLAEQFETHRPKMRAVAYRLLGSGTDADDAVQETWVRLDRSDAEVIDNLEAWLMTTVGRIALNMLRTRTNRREMPLDHEPDPTAGAPADPELEVLLADTIGSALQVVLDTLTPAERVAYVLHDTFTFPFTEVGRILDRSPEATRQLASRARRRIRDLDLDCTESSPVRVAEHDVVQAFLTASRDGRFAALLDVLDPDLVERVATADGPIIEVHGAETVARRATEFSRHYTDARPAWINGWPGWIAYRHGTVYSVGALSITGGRISRMDVILDPARLADLHIAHPPATSRHEAGGTDRGPE